MEEPSGIQFPAADDGRRSTTAVGRGVVADALRAVDPVGAGEAERETSWRSGYVPHFRRLVDAGLATPVDARRIASDGLASLRRRMRVVHDGAERPLDQWPDEPTRPLATLEVRGTQQPAAELSLPLHGERLA